MSTKLLFLFILKLAEDPNILADSFKRLARREGHNYRRIVLMFGGGASCTRDQSAATGHLDLLALWQALGATVNAQG